MAPEPAVDRDTVVVGLGEEPDVLVQDYSLRHVTWAILSPLMLKLVRYDDSWRAWPELAADVPSPRNGSWRTLQDGRTEVSWRLRGGLSWHDGTPVTAHDALFTYELLKRTPPPYPHHTIVESISEMIVPDDDPHALIVRWDADKPFAPYEEWGTLLPRHLLADAGLEDEVARDRHWFLRAPVLDGPFRFVAWEPSSHIVLKRRGAHPRGLPRLRRLVFRFFDGPASLADAVVSGEVDVTDLTGFGPADAASIAAAADGVEVFETPSLMWEHIDFNLDDPILADRRVRHAIAHAIDREALSAELFAGRQPIAHSWLPERHPAYNSDVRTYPHDPARARALLASAGYRPGSDGILVSERGERLSLGLMTTTPPSGNGLWTASAVRPQLAELLRGQLHRVGIELRVELVRAEDLFPRLRRRQFDQLALFAWSMGLETTGYLLWHSAKIPDDEDWYGLNVSGWRHVGNDRILDAIADEPDDEQRFLLMREQQAVWAEELPSMPLFFPRGVTTAKSALRNVRPVGVFGAYVTWNSWQWHWNGAHA